MEGARRTTRAATRTTGRIWATPHKRIKSDCDTERHVRSSPDPGAVRVSDEVRRVWKEAERQGR